MRGIVPCSRHAAAALSHAESANGLDVPRGFIWSSVSRR